MSSRAWSNTYSSHTTTTTLTYGEALTLSALLLSSSKSIIVLVVVGEEKSHHLVGGGGETVRRDAYLIFDTHSPSSLSWVYLFCTVLTYTYFLPSPLLTYAQIREKVF